MLYKRTSFTKSDNIIYAWNTDFSVKNDSITFRFLSKERHRFSKAVIYDINNRAVDSISYSANKRGKISAFQWLLGIKDADSVVYHRKLIHGLYSVEHKTSFVVPNLSAKVLLVIPHLTEICANKKLPGRFDTPIVDSLDFFMNNYSVSLNENTKVPFVINYNRASENKFMEVKNAYHLLRQKYDANEIGFISDMELVNGLMNYQQLKGLIFTGNFTYMETGVFTVLKDFLLRGRNMLIATPFFMNNRVRINRKNKQIEFYGELDLDPVKDPKNSAICFNNPFSSEWNYSLVGSDYSLAGDSKSKYLRIESESHMLFYGLNVKKGDSIEINASFFSGFPLKYGTFNNSYADIDSLNFAASIECVNGKGGIGIVKPKLGKGKAICLGTDSWFKNNDNKSDTVKKIIENAISALLNN